MNYFEFLFAHQRNITIFEDINQTLKLKFMKKLEGITITLTHEKSEELFFNSLCGADVLAGYDLQLETIPAEYKAAREVLATQKNAICREDVWMQILRNGGTLTIVDKESDEEYPITIKEVHERVQNTDLHYLEQAINEEGDATTDDVILQTVFLNEVIFG